MSRETDGKIYDLDAILDVAVSFDGTWSKRGYTANFGTGVLMSVDTGEVIGFVVLSRICEHKRSALSIEEF